MKRDMGKEQFWRKAIAEARSSGQSVPEFCRQRGLKAHLFYFWRRELRGREAAATDRPGFVELVGPAETSGAGVSLRIDGRTDIRLERGFDRGTLLAALACLSDPCRPVAAAEACGR